MKVFVLHSHLRTGGVSKVIHSQIQSLRSHPGNPIKVRLLLGEKPGGSVPGLSKKDILVYSGLKYLPDKLTAHSLKVRLRALVKFLKLHIAFTDVIHAHNANLGKNPLVPIALYQLNLEGYKVLNHCHDFAEDGRYGNYAHLKAVISGVFGLPLLEVLYPNRRGYHFAVLTTRDAVILKKTGLAATRIHLLMNPVWLPNLDAHTILKPAVIRTMLAINNDLPIYTYPVRAIRRKNIGEFFLLAALFPGQGNWLITQNPQNPVEWQAYDYWKKQVEQYGMPVVFEAGNRTDFLSLVACSRFIITTSIKEGFGLGFLEPWLQNVPIVGRDIPTVTRDFKARGILLKRVYRHMRIPLQWLPSPALLVENYAAYITRACRKLELPVHKDLEKRLHRCLFSGDRVDFALLEREGQVEVIKRVTQRDSDRQKLISLNRLGRFLSPLPPSIIRGNKSLIRRHFNLHQYARKLKTIYQRLLLESSRTSQAEAGPINAENPLIRHFTALDNFYLINKK